MGFLTSDVVRYVLLFIIFIGIPATLVTVGTVKGKEDKDNIALKIVK